MNNLVQLLAELSDIVFEKIGVGRELLYFFKAVWEESLGKTFGGFGQVIDEFQELIEKAVFLGICNLW
jgi:hypothetical protein